MNLKNAPLPLWGIVVGFVLASLWPQVPTLATPSHVAAPSYSEEPRMGAIVAYGNILEPPYRFSSIDSDTLTVNGVPIHPARQSIGFVGSVRSDGLSPFNDLFSQDLLDDFWEHYRRESRTAEPSVHARKSRTLEILRSAPHVIEAKDDGGELFVRFTFTNGFVPFILGETSRDQQQRRTTTIQDARRVQVRQIESAIATGGVVAFGSSYFHFLPAAERERVLELVRAVHSRGLPGGENELPGLGGMLSEVLQDVAKVRRTRR